ncbi:hypothetical protein KR044_003657 [Drosophila immigrans]|nr:hypothetical protein KR044_003657 [Drosophila immigrans]
MAKFQVVLLIAVGLLAIVEAQQQRQQQQRQQRLTRGRSRYFARQELAPAADADAAVTPYPLADELKPDVPFDEAAAPAAAEPTPDAVYGPPDAPAPNNVPDEVYGPPDVTGNDLPAAADVPAEQARLVAARRAAKLRRAGQPAAVSRRVVSAAARPAKLSSAARRF